MARVGPERHAKSASGGASLGTNGDRFTPPRLSGGSDRVKRQGRRRSRWRLKAGQRRLTESISGRYCWLPTVADVPVDVGRGLVAHVSGIRRCGSPWSCPVCAPVVRERRALEIDAALQFHLAAGGGAVFVTLTLRHHRGDELAPRLELVTEALRACLHGAAWERRRRRVGYIGAIRAVEVTWREENGWHPHVHAVLLLERPIGAGEADELRGWLLGRWGGVCERRGFGTITAAHGVDVQVVKDAGDLPGYLAKVEGGWGAGHELARGDVKVGRAKSLVPAELLERFLETGESRFRQLWLEYERATFGKRAIVWSRGLRSRLLGSTVEETDASLAASEGMEDQFVRFLVGKGELWAAVKAGVVGDLLSQIEAVAAEFWNGEVDGQEEAEGAQPAGQSARRAEAGWLRLGDLGSAGSVRVGVGDLGGECVSTVPNGPVALMRWAPEEGAA